MNRQSAVALGIAVVVGLIAVFLANSYFNGVQSEGTEVRATALRKIAIATQPIALGGPLTNTNTALADWPATSIPPGAFTDLGQATTNRVALDLINPGEPILASRVSGTDGRATLSVRLDKDRYAVSLPVNEVSGVGGFVRPGDVVDVMLTRPIPGMQSNQQDRMTEVVLQGVKVLGIDQVADKSKTDPAIGKTATVEVDLLGAQKLALSRELGTLTLALRNIANASPDIPRTITSRDLSGRTFIVRREVPAPMARPAAPRPVQVAVSAPPRPVAPRPSGPSMTIIRRGTPTTYEVRNGY